jgi:hypothetical protein
VSDRVDATVDRQEPTGGDPMVDRAAAESRIAQLQPRHETVLAFRQHADQLILSPLFIHDMNKGATALDSPPEATALS